MKNIVIFGCQQIAVDVIQHILNKKKYNISLVVTYELEMDKVYKYKSVKSICEKNNIEFISSKELDDNLINKIKKISPHVILSIYYRKILPKRIFDIPICGSYNIHPGKLPYYRGPIPTMWAIQNGEKEFGVTLHKIDSGIDTGDIVDQKVYPIKSNDTGYIVYARAMKFGAQIIIKNLERIINKTIKLKKQKGKGSYYGKYSGDDFINWRNKAEDIKNFIRARAYPYNSAKTKLGNSYMFIDKARILKNYKYQTQLPGRVLNVYKNKKMAISTSEGVLLLEDYKIYPPLNTITKKVYLKKGVKFD